MSDGELELPNAKRHKPNEATTMAVNVASRESKLAMIQTNYVIDQLKLKYNNHYNFGVLSMKTTGDHILDRALSQIGSKSLFTKELEEALLARRAQFIVHSLKDLPTTLPEGCCIGAILKREDPSDALVLRKGLELSDPFSVLGSQSDTDAQSSAGDAGTKKPYVIGTSSHRRISQIRKVTPDAKVSDCRGNINTRFAKLDGEHSYKPEQVPVDYDCLILATSGLIRGGFEDRISLRLGKEHGWYHAVGQGALAIECRIEDETTLELVSCLIDFETVCETIAERSLMLTLEGGCSVPIGVRCDWSADKTELTLYGAIFSLDGSQSVTGSMSVVLPDEPDVKEPPTNGKPEDVANYTGLAVPKCPFLKKRYAACVQLGKDLAKQLNKAGGAEILDEIKNSRK